MTRFSDKRAPSRRPGIRSESPDSRSALEQELAFLVRWLEAIKRDHQYPLERAHYLMLLLLMEDGPQNVSRIAERLRLDNSTVTRQVAVMIKRGLVDKQANPEDRRGGMICATAFGHGEANRMRQMREEKVELMATDWPESKRQSLAEALGEVNDSLCQMLDRNEI